MSLPLSDIVQVDIAVAPTLAPLAGFGELLFLTDDVEDLKVIGTGERQRKFGSLKEVQDAFPSNSHCVFAATAFYSQTPQPKDFTVGVMALAATAGTLVGGAHANLETLKTITAGNGKFSIDGTKYNFANLDFSSATDLADVATKLQVALRAGTAVAARASKTAVAAVAELEGVTVVYSGGRFVVGSGTTGEDSFVDFFDLDLDTTFTPAKRLGLTQEEALSANHGTAAETVSQALGACANISDTFVAVATHYKLRDLEAHVSGASGAAAWCEASKKIFMNTTNDMGIFDSAKVEATEAYKLKNKAFSKTITTYGRALLEYPSVSLFGRIATVNYEGVNTTITLKFKRLPGISALNLTNAQKKAMDAVNVGGFMNFGGQLMYAESRMADNGWLDTVHGLMWLEDRIKKGVFNLMYGSTTKVPYTDTGINMVVQKVTTALEQARANGLIAAGNTPEGEFLPLGYKITALSSTQVAAEDKSNRIYRGITFQCIGAGALHNVIISGSFSE